MRLSISIRGCVRPSIGPSVRRSVGPYFRTMNMAVFDIIINNTMVDYGVVASDVPPRYLLLQTQTAKPKSKRWTTFSIIFSMTVVAVLSFIALGVALTDSMTLKGKSLFIFYYFFINSIKSFRYVV